MLVAYIVDPSVWWRCRRWTVVVVHLPHFNAAKPGPPPWPYSGLGAKIRDAFQWIAHQLSPPSHSVSQLFVECPSLGRSHCPPRPALPPSSHLQGLGPGTRRINFPRSPSKFWGPRLDLELRLFRKRAFGSPNPTWRSGGSTYKVEFQVA